MKVRDLQEFLDKFTEGAQGLRGNAVSNAVIMVEFNGRLYEIRRSRGPRSEARETFPWFTDQGA
jgi:hypothetical protein